MKTNFFRLFKVCFSVTCFLLINQGCQRENPVELPVVSTLPATSVTTNSASSGGNVTYSGSAPVTSRGVVWDTIANPTFEKHSGITQDGQGSGPFVSILTGLTPGTDYFVRSYAVTILGSAYGNEVEFTTEGEPASVTTAVVTNISSVSATSGGNVTDEGSTEVTARGVVWHNSETMSLDVNTGYTTDGEGAGAFISEVTGLTAGTTYYLRAYATNGAGTTYGNPVEFETATHAGNVSDVSGNRYKIITIGNQLWMAENLRTKRYADGTLIAGELASDSWKNTTQGAYSIYPHSISSLDDEEEVLAAYGALYNWYAVQDERGLCPAGWKVPSDDDWAELTEYLSAQFGLNNEPGDANGLANSLKSCHQVSSPLGDNCSTNEHPRWNSNNVHHGTDNFGFAALPGSNRDANGSYGLIGSSGLWWTSTGDGEQGPVYHSITVNAGNLQRASGSRNMGLSVRCIKQ
jgi:uncharacterized protein (TIGR02145 family)